AEPQPRVRLRRGGDAGRGEGNGGDDARVHDQAVGEASSFVAVSVPRRPSRAPRHFTSGASMSASGTPRLALLALAALSLIWGYNWVVMKQVIEYVDPFDFSAIRTVLGAATLFLVLLVLRKPMSLVAARQVALLGVLQTGAFTALI